MPDIKCITPGCTAYISDPCIMIKGLFLKKLDLEVKRGHTNDEIDMINKILHDDLGLKNHEELFDNFKRDHRKKKTAKSQPILFNLVCINGHRNQYYINCKKHGN